jgi:hypothetical protein
MLASGVQGLDFGVEVLAPGVQGLDSEDDVLESGDDVVDSLVEKRCTYYGSRSIMVEVCR